MYLKQPVIDIPAQKLRAPRNRTLTIAAEETLSLIAKTITLETNVKPEDIHGSVIHQDIFECIRYLPDAFIDLLVIDPPYNLNKTFSETKFSKTTSANYEQWLDSWMQKLIRVLNPNAMIIVCFDLQSSSSFQSVLHRHFIVRNRITCEREKGGVATTNSVSYTHLDVYKRQLLDKDVEIVIRPKAANHTTGLVSVLVAA